MEGFEPLPVEMIAEVMSHLRPHDLTVLARVSKCIRDIAQPTLWKSIELHRRDAHHTQFGLRVQQKAPKRYIDEHLRDPWSYRTGYGADPEFEERVEQFWQAIQHSQRLAKGALIVSTFAPYIRELCLTVRWGDQQFNWNRVLSFQNLRTLELIGEFGILKGIVGPAPVTTEPAATKVSSVRLRGYIPGDFVTALCKASASTIVSLDLGILEPPKFYTRKDDEYGPYYWAPRGVLWYKGEEVHPFTSLTHLLLCKRGADDAAPRDNPETYDIFEDEEHDILEYKQWASLLRAVRTTLVELVLEHRPFDLDYLIQANTGVSPDTEPGNSNGFDSRLYETIFKGVFADGGEWPKLRKLILRGINFVRFTEKAEETLEGFRARVLPQVKFYILPGNLMFFNTRRGLIKNKYGADGLKPHLDHFDPASRLGIFVFT